MPAPPAHLSEAEFSGPWTDGARECGGRDGERGNADQGHPDGADLERRDGIPGERYVEGETGLAVVPKREGPGIQRCVRIALRAEDAVAARGDDPVGDRPARMRRAVGD